jgi:hypothetical protein
MESGGTQAELAALLAKALEKLSADADKLILDHLQTQLVLGCCGLSDATKARRST